MRYLLCLPLLLTALTAHAESFVWKVSKGANHIYLGGTFHLLKEEDYPLPKEFEQAYEKVNWLVFETDIGKLETAEFQQQFQQAFLLPEGQTLKTSLSDDAFRKLNNYCLLNNIDLQQFMAFKPQFITLIITVQELQKYGLTAEGVDSYFYNKAKTDGKITSQLESIESQIQYLANMAQGNEDNLIEQTLADARELEAMMNGLRNAWRTGNEEKLNLLGNMPMLTDYPEIYRSLLVERNNNWMPRIKNLIKHPESKFVLVGALHLAGNDGLLNLLAQQDYRIEQLR
ncbi:MAG: TraB/GumN family protein [Saccharospirillaceae bacterium]|nr:TraB/GumN family protein [Saccharospirillaceae bacterium]